MKYTIFTLFLIAFAGLFQACSKDDIEVFHGKQQIYFDKFYINAIAPGTETADSTVESFGIYPEETQQISAKVVVCLSGTIPTEDIQFQLKTAEGTTMESSEYSLDDFYTFHAGKVTGSSTDIRDTIEIKLNRSGRLESAGEQGIRLVVELVPNDKVDLGQYERRRAVIVSTLYPARPAWWDPGTDIGAEVIYTLLGEYSPQKYILFMQHADIDNEMSEELITHHPDRALALARIFKEWLVENLGDPENGALYKEILDSLP